MRQTEPAWRYAGSVFASDEAPSPERSSGRRLLVTALYRQSAQPVLDGTLPPEYLERFGDRRGMDGAFLRFFRLEKDAFVEGVRKSNGSDAAAAKWFYAQPGVTDEKVNDWNRLAPSSGNPANLVSRRFNR